MAGGIIKQIELNGIKLFIREEQPAFDDLHVVNEVITENCYKLTPEQVKDKVVVDIGANIGSFSLLAWKWRAKQVIAFEPEPHNFDILKMNIVLNNADIEIHNKAVGIKGWTKIDNSSGHSQTGRDIGVDVEVVSLNDLDIDKIDLLKCDAEGGEYEIIETINNETLNKIQRIVGEFHSWRWEKDPKRHKNLVKRLEQFFELSYYGFKNSNFIGIKR